MRKLIRIALALFVAFLFWPVAPPADASSDLGTITGRIVVTGTFQYINDPAGPACANERVMAGFVINYSGPVSGSAVSNLCNPEPYYSVQVPPGTYAMTITTPSGWTGSADPSSVTMTSGGVQHVWLGASQASGAAGNDSPPTAPPPLPPPPPPPPPAPPAPGTIQGRIMVSATNQFVRDPAGPACANEQAAAGFVISYSGPASGATTANLCNPQPYYSVSNLPAGDYKVWLDTPSGWQVIGANLRQAAVESGQLNHQWFAVEKEQTTAPAPTPLPSIAVTTPRGGEKWELGKTYPVAWTSTGVSKVSIRLSVQSGSIRDFHLDSNPGSYNLVVPADIGTGATKLYVMDTATMNSVNAVFGVPQNGYVYLTAPPPPALPDLYTKSAYLKPGADGQPQLLATICNSALAIGQALPMEVDLNGSNHKFDLGGGIATLAASCAEYELKLTAAQQAAVRSSNTVMVIVDAGNFAVVESDEFNNVYTATLAYNVPTPAASITVIYPNGGETLGIGNTYEVKWKSNGVAGNVDIYLNTLRLGSGGWAYIAQNVPNTGSYMWDTTKDLIHPAGSQLYLTPGNDFSMTIFSSSDHNIYDTSDSRFSMISAPTLVTGTLLGRIKTDNGKFIRDPAGPVCQNELVGAGFVISYSGPASGSTTANLCNPEPLYSVNLPSGFYKVWLDAPYNWQVIGENLRAVTIDSSQLNHQWFQVSPKSDVVIPPPVPAAPGTLLGRIQTDSGKFIRDPSGPACSNELVGSNFVINYSGAGTTGAVSVNKCNPEPYYAVTLIPGNYKIWLDTSSTWQVIGQNLRSITIDSSQLNHQWFQVSPKSDVVIPPPVPAAPGVLLGRIQTDTGRFISVPADTPSRQRCFSPNELPAAGFQVNFQRSDGQLGGGAVPVLCNQEPYYSVELTPGTYDVWLDVPAAWQVTGQNRRTITIQSAQLNHQWFQVSPKSDVVIPPPVPAGPAVTIRARGTFAAGSYPIMQLWEGGTTLAEWQVTGVFKDYVFSRNSPFGLENLRVYSINDYFNRATGADRNLIVDYLKIGPSGQIYQSEDPGTFAHGVWFSGQGCSSGFGLGEILHCNGYFEYPVMALPSR